ncbi:uncharacterized protein PV09_03966 [Verruconis gallopava]|uniref:Uncharacterized protein n=1 Tax=Verruconis gallopava TaxID=253628 RepID=A0A0D1YVQ0_9PEZI|nr:uncharacterized protein PV09_03966 [Verruconis gallopava]KIW04777.1 hypothetical protein PV09_03966 [Verruconis gallopava]
MSRSFSYERYDNSRHRPARSSRSAITYWVPLVITVTLAAGGIAAWVWSARDEYSSTDQDVTSDDENLSYGEEARVARERYGRDPRGGGAESSVSEGVIRDDEYISGGRNGADESTFVGGLHRGVQEAIRRTPSPQQAFDSVKRFGAAGIAAAGAAVGGALSAIREESTESRNRRENRQTEEGFSDHERWSEEAEKRVVSHAEQSREAVSANVTAFGDSLKEGPKQYTGGRRKMVAIVLSSEIMLDQMQEEDGKYHAEHASLLSHLPPVDPSTTSVHILIYNPNPSSGKTPPRAPSSIGSSYAAINTPAQTPGEELQSLDPQPYTPPGTTPALSARSSGGDPYDLLYKQAVRIVEDPVNVLTFETPQGWVHMCKHMQPDLVYVVDSLSGPKGQNVEAVKGWVGQVVVVVGGGGTGLGGLIDTEDESDIKGKERASGERPWWVDSDLIGLGKGVEIVDGNRFSDDWERRAGGKE